MKNMLLLLVTLSNLTFAQGNREYPMGPLKHLTPGKLCDQPTRYRYPEQIAYCERDVDTYTKEAIFSEYRRAGFRLNTNNRSSFKIDHFVPLCAGGSNDSENLWPQHISLFQITDPIEKLACDKMAQGRIGQSEAVRLVTAAKVNIRMARQVMNDLARR